jgi:hypothetical protein
MADINSLYFVSTLQGYLNVDDVGALSPKAGLTIVAAINRALSDWFSLVPSGARRVPFTEGLIHAPRVFNVQVTNNSSQISFVDPGPESTAVGCTLMLGGDNVQNTLVSPTQLHLPYRGPSGVVQGTLYGDGIALPTGFVMLASLVTCHIASTLRYELRPMSEIQPETARPAVWLFPFSFLAAAQPTHFRIIPGQTLQGLPPNAMLQVWPPPTQECRLEFEYSGRPQPWTLADLSKPRQLDLTDHAWNYIHTLTLDHLRTSGLLASTIDRREIMADAEKARKSLENTPVPNTGSPNLLIPQPGW